MELQAIREKLLLLQSEPPTVEAPDLPWADSTKSLSAARASASRSDNSRMPIAPKNIAENVVESAAQPTKLDGSNGSFQTALDFADAATDNRSTGEIGHRTSQSLSQSPTVAIETTLETLQQRSLTNDPTTQARITRLIAQETYRLEAQSHQINEQSQRLAADLLSLKRSAQQAAVGLRRQGVQDHPQMAFITDFLEQYAAASVPHLERDSQGHFTLTYDSVEFHRAEQEAFDTANKLRERRTAAVPFSQPVSASSYRQPGISGHFLVQEGSEGVSEYSSDYAEEGLLDHPLESPKTEKARLSRRSRRQSYRFASHWVKASLKPMVAWIDYLLNKRARPQPSLAYAGEPSSAEGIQEGFNVGADAFSPVFSSALLDPSFNDEAWEEGIAEPQGSHGATRKRAHYSSFSWLDGTIWFSGAAIARILFQSIAVQYAIVQPLLAIGLVGAIALALYRVIFDKSADYSLAYQLCVGMVGWLLAGLF
jgi:hypothetical protein